MNSLPQNPFIEPRVDRISMPPEDFETVRLVGEYNNHQVKTCPSSSSTYLTLMRGLPGHGKTHYADSLENVQIVSADLVAAERQAKDMYNVVTGENKKQLANLYYRMNSANVAHKGLPKAGRQNKTAELHAEAQSKMRAILESSSSDSQKKIVVDNTNIAPWEAAGYFAIAMEYGVPLENIEIVDVNPFNNPKFRDAIQQQMDNESVVLSCPPENWPGLSFKSTMSGRDETIEMSDPIAQRVVCNALKTVREDALPFDYLKNRLEKYIRFSPMKVTDLIKSAIKEPVKSHNPLSTSSTAGRHGVEANRNHRSFRGQTGSESKKDAESNLNWRKP